MAFVAARTSAGTKRQVNEDACCIEVAETPLGEVLMAVVCDGVGGLSRGNVASSTVIDRFTSWFERELPALMEGMVEGGRFDFGIVKAVWGVLLQDLNELIRTYGARTGARLGTTFTGIVACGGRYLVGHVGDCRAYLMDATSFRQLTEDQTLVAKQLADGEITAEEARRAPKNVILQAVGSQRALNPVFYEGLFTANDLFVICCDGAYHRAENEGVRKLFQSLDYRNEAVLAETCDTLLQFDMDYGEKDNLTVVCFSGALAGAGEAVVEPVRPVTVAASVDVEDDAPTMVGADEGFDEDDLATMVESDEDDLATMVDAGEDADEDELATTVESDEDEDDVVTMVADDGSGEDDLATMVDGGDEDDLATMVDAGDNADEDDLATMVEAGDEDDLATMVDAGEDADEDDLATMVADDGDDWDDDDWDDDDLGLPTFSSHASDDEDEDEDEDEEPAWASDFEDEAPTMVVGDLDDDDLPTMVEGADA